MNNPFTLYSRRRSGAKLSRLDRTIVSTLRWARTLLMYGVAIPLSFIGTSLLSLIVGVAILAFVLLVGALILTTGVGILVLEMVLLVIGLVVAPFYDR